MSDVRPGIHALRAWAHPVRLRMLSLLTGTTAMSAAEVARELDLTHANASYHLRVLLDAGELIEAGEERIRGGVAKRYRYPHERGATSPGEQLPSRDDQVAYARAVGDELVRRIAERSVVRGLGHSSDLDGWVDPAVWQRALALMREASRLLHDHNTAPRTPGALHVSATTFAFALRGEER